MKDSAPPLVPGVPAPAAFERGLRVLANAIPHLVWIADPSGAMLFFNDHFFAYTGLSPEATITDAVWGATIHPDDATAFGQVRDEALRTGNACEWEYRLRRGHDGAWRWHLGRARVMRDAAGAGSVVRWVGTATDIEEVKRAQWAKHDASARVLRDSEERLRLATRSAGLGTWELNLRTGERTWDRQMGELYGATSDELGTDGDRGLPRRLVHPDDRDEAQAHLDAAIQTGGMYEAEYRIVQPSNGRVRWVRAAGQVLCDPDSGTPIRVLGTAMDITVRREAEAAATAAAAAQQHIAETLQRSLLIVPRPDAYPGIAVGTIYESAYDDALIGGDFFDVFAAAEGKVALVVGDVTGKGLTAAAGTAEVKFALRAFLRDTSGDPSDALERLNRFLLVGQRSDATPRSGYIAVSVAVVDTVTGETVCACAGAEPPLLQRRVDGTKAAFEVPVAGTLLGAIDTGEWDSVLLTLRPGDRLFLATDGLTEARRILANPLKGHHDLRELFGVERLAQAAGEARVHADPTDAARFVVDAALAYASGLRSDDICLLVAERR